jgi:hypothetical protein
MILLQFRFFLFSFFVGLAGLMGSVLLATVVMSLLRGDLEEMKVRMVIVPVSFTTNEILCSANNSEERAAVFTAYGPLLVSSVATVVTSQTAEESSTKIHTHRLEASGLTHLDPSNFGHQTEDKLVGVNETEHEQSNQEGGKKEETNGTATDHDQTKEYPTDIEDAEEYSTELEDNEKYPDTDVMDSEDQYSGAEDTEEEEPGNNEIEDQQSNVEEAEEEAEEEDVPDFETEEAFHIYLMDSIIERRPLNIQPGIQWLPKRPSDDEK